MARVSNLQSVWTPHGVVVVGGGRWARILIDELARIEPPIESIRVVTLHNQLGMRRWLDAHAGDVPGVNRIEVLGSLEAALDDAIAEAVVIANMPAAHAASVRRAIEAGLPVLVEKPFTPTAAEATDLVGLADQSGLVLTVGHEMHYVSWPRHVAEMVDEPTFLKIEWLEPTSSDRHGEVKTPDWTVGVVADLLPHVLTIAQRIAGTAGCSISGLEVSGPTVTMDVDFGGLGGLVRLARGAAQGQRRCILSQADGATIEADFTSMPAVITKGDDRIIIDDQVPSVQAELRAFFSAIADGQIVPIQADKAISIVAATERAVSMVRDHTEEAFRSALRKSVGTAPPPDLIFALREHLLPALFDEGLVTDPKDESKIDRWVTAAFSVAHTLATYPFEPMVAVAERCELGLDEMAPLSRIIRASPLFQTVIVHGGVGWKYWANTILPLIASGAVNAAMDGVAAYPFRVGVYPAVSCMFKCTFCGRDYDAKYDRASIAAGNAQLRTMFDHAPSDDPHRFYLSGGLEPLTNPEIGDLVQHGTDRGFSLSLYTNAFMLTPRYLERQQGLWDLATLRISLFGVDEETTYAVTRKRNACAQVLRNAEAFMVERDRRGSAVRLGFNFVILPGQSHQVLEVVELIAGLNRRTGGRQVDFLTLREDYSVPPELGLRPEERLALVGAFGRLDERINQPDLDQLQIDYGYSLQALAEGGLGRSLEMVDFADIRPAAYPQISVVVDLLGNVYAYREAGFIDRPGADRYILGRITPERQLDDVVRDFVERNGRFDVMPGDTCYFDIFDHVVTALLNQAEADSRAGIHFSAGPVIGRDPAGHPSRSARTLAHPTLAEK